MFFHPTWELSCYMQSHPKNCKSFLVFASRPIRSEALWNFIPKKKKREDGPEFTSKQLEPHVSMLAGLWLESRNRSGSRAAQQEMGKALLPA